MLLIHPFSPLIDNNYTGFYAWPRSYTTYALREENTPFIEVVEESREAYEVLRAAFLDTKYWEKVLTYTSQEVTSAHEDVFNSIQCELYVMIFQHFEDAPLNVVKEHIHRLLDNSDSKHHQRALAEILSGIILGSKHWPLSKLETLWTWILPILEKSFSNITPDSLNYWEHFVRSTLVSVSKHVSMESLCMIVDETRPKTCAAFAGPDF